MCEPVAPSAATIRALCLYFASCQSIPSGHPPVRSSFATSFASPRRAAVAQGSIGPAASVSGNSSDRITRRATGTSIDVRCCTVCRPVAATPARARPKSYLVEPYDMVHAIPTRHRQLQHAEHRAKSLTWLAGWVLRCRSARARAPGAPRPGRRRPRPPRRRRRAPAGRPSGVRYGHACTGGRPRTDDPH